MDFTKVKFLIPTKFSERTNERIGCEKWHGLPAHAFDGVIV